jgi:hypothetical protein
VGRVRGSGCGVVVAYRVAVAVWQCVVWTGLVVGIILRGDFAKIGALLTELGQLLSMAILSMECWGIWRCGTRAWQWFGVVVAYRVAVAARQCVGSTGCVLGIILRGDFAKIGAVSTEIRYFNALSTLKNAN